MPETGEAVKFELMPSRLAKAPSHRLDFVVTFLIKQESKNKKECIPFTIKQFWKCKPDHFL